MTRRSHGKARPSLPRSAELRPIETAPDPSAGRGTHGQFARGNQISIRAGEKRAAKKLLGKGASEGDAAIVARDAQRAFRGAMRELPHDGQIVRSLAALYGRHLAASALYATKSDEAGPATDEGIRFAELALKHGARAERLSVTALDVAATLARAKPAAPFPWLTAPPRPATTETPGRDEGDEAPEDQGGDEDASERDVVSAQGGDEDDADDVPPHAVEPIKPGFDPAPSKPGVIVAPAFPPAPLPTVYVHGRGYVRADEVPRPVGAPPTAEQIARARAKAMRADDDPSRPRSPR
jgi:hypothetical protein